jgi:hypothetical protein
MFPFNGGSFGGSNVDLFEGKPLLLPVTSIKRAFQLVAEEKCRGPPLALLDYAIPPRLTRAALPPGLGADGKTARRTGDLAAVPTSVGELAALVAATRADCMAQGLIALFHYTERGAALQILKEGIRMSTSGQGDGGVFFSTRSPLSYGAGAADPSAYERNVITDCFGEERLGEYLGQGRLGACIVYAAEPRSLAPAPGGRANARMVHRSYFDTLARPVRTVHGGSVAYFLRPDAIKVALLLNPSVTPLPPGKGGAAAAASHVAEQIRLDEAGAQDLLGAQKEAERNARRAQQLSAGIPVEDGPHDGGGFDDNDGGGTVVADFLASRTASKDRLLPLQGASAVKKKVTKNRPPSRKNSAWEDAKSKRLASQASIDSIHVNRRFHSQDSAPGAASVQMARTEDV